LYSTKEKKKGLKAIFCEQFHCDFEKDKAITCSEWNVSEFSLQQIKYACLDAWTSCMIGRKDMSKHGPYLFDFLLWKCEHLKWLAKLSRHAGLQADFQKKKYQVSCSWKAEDRDLKLLLKQYETRVREKSNAFAELSDGEICKCKVKKVQGKTAIITPTDNKIKIDQIKRILADNLEEWNLISKLENSIRKIAHKGFDSYPWLLEMIDKTDCPPLVPPSLNLPILNKSQVDAITKLLSSRVTAIQGPPGINRDSFAKND
jgi:hypothetical protein